LREARIVVVKLDFEYDGIPAGCFTEGGSYPSAPGAYRYMPYRGPGHLRMLDELRGAGFARCTCVGPEGRMTFVVRACPEYGLLVLDDVTQEVGPGRS
jgi:hypothetical protein